MLARFFISSRCAWVLCLTSVLSGPLSSRAERGSNWHMFKAADGLAESYCGGVTASPTGDIWVKHSEANQVSYLDGYTIRTIPAPGPDNFRVYESLTGQRWSLYSGGVMVYAGQQWIHRPVPEIAEEIRSDPRRRVHEIPLVPAERNHLFFLLPDKLMDYDLTEKKATVIKRASETSLGRFQEMTAGRNDGLWITGTAGLGHLPGPLRRLHSGALWQEFLVDPALHVENLQRPFEDDHGELTMVATDTAANNRRVLVHFDGHTWAVRTSAKGNFRQAWPGWDATTWAFTFDSLLRFDPPPLTNVYREKVWAGQYKDVATESNGVFWVATSEGLFRYAPYVWRTPLPLEDLSSHVLALLEEAPDRLWVAVTDFLMCRENGIWRTIPWPSGAEGSFDTPTALYNLPDGRLVISAADRITLYNPRTDQYQALVYPSNRRVRIVGQLPDHSLIVQVRPLESGAADSFELEKFDGSEFRPFLKSPAPWTLGNEIYFVLALPNGDDWLGGSDGVARFRNGTWEVYGPAQGYRAAKALTMIEMGGGRLWCAGRDKIFEFNGKNWTLVRAGFDRIARMVRGHDEKMWVATAQGLYGFSSINNSWISQGVEEGLPSPGVSDVLVDTNGQVWAGTTRGLSLYHPDADHSPPLTLPPMLDSPSSRVSGDKVAVLLNGEDRWQATPTERLLFATRLDDGVWSAYTNSAVKVFEHLGAGKHRVEVRAMDRNWNEDHESALLDFAVVLSWYKDPRLLLIVLFGAVLVVFFAGLAVNRHLQLIRSYAEVERIVALRTQELEQANQQLLQTQKMRALGTLAAGIAHDFNNILSIIRGSAQIIQNSLDDRQKVLTRLSRIQAVVEQGSSLVRSMLGLSRVKEKDFAPADLNAVVEDTVRLISERFLRDVTAEFNPTPGLPSVVVPRELIQQILLNLILNAADAMEHRGVVQLRTTELRVLPGNLALAPERSPHYLAVSVQDSGCGIAPEILPRIFEPFFTTKALSVRRGTGLGLSIVYELSRELGYGLEVTSTLAQGSTFTLILPLGRNPLLGT